MAQPMAHHFGSASTHVHGAPKLSEHLAGQQSPGDKVVTLDQVHCWTANFDNRGDNDGTCYVIVCNSSEQDYGIYINTMSMVVDSLAVARTLPSDSQTADDGAAPLVFDIATSP